MCEGKYEVHEGVCEGYEGKCVWFMCAHEGTISVYLTSIPLDSSTL